MRLDKFLRHQSTYSRSQVHQLIRKKRVLVNGQCVTNVHTQLAATDTVQLDSIVVPAIAPRYFMVHKPQGTTCTNASDDTSSILTLLNEVRATELIIAGRLDKDTTGLVLVTDDGQWAHQITSPHKHCSKCYRVQTADLISEATIERFAQGVSLRDNPKPTQPATLIPIDAYNAWLTLTEGRYHQVKRMFGALGNRVVSLHRQRMGAIELDATLAPGQYRPLTSLEIQTSLQ